MGLYRAPMQASTKVYGLPQEGTAKSLRSFVARFLGLSGFCGLWRRFYRGSGFHLGAGGLCIQVTKVLGFLVQFPGT